MENKASAQEDLPSPANIRVTDGDKAGEVVVSWDSVDGMADYSVRWVNVDAALVVYHAGGNWEQYIQSADIEGSDTTTHTLTVTRPRSGAQYAIADAQFYQLLSKISDAGASDSGNPTTEDVLGYTHTTDLSAGVEVAQTLLLVASGLRNPAYVARVEEAFDEMAGRVDRNVACLRENSVEGLDDDVLNLAANMRDASGAGEQVDYFVRLERHLELRAKENGLIEQNEGILNRLLEQADALSLEVQGIGRAAGADDGSRGHHRSRN